MEITTTLGKVLCTKMTHKFVSLLKFNLPLRTFCPPPPPAETLQSMPGCGGMNSVFTQEHRCGIPVASSLSSDRYKGSKCGGRW